MTVGELKRNLESFPDDYKIKDLQLHIQYDKNDISRMTKEEYLNSDFVTMLHLNNQVAHLSQINKKLEKENEQLKDKVKSIRDKLFNILTDYEIGNYDSNIHQFYKDVYDIHNELMEVEEC